MSDNLEKKNPKAIIQTTQKDKAIQTWNLYIHRIEQACPVSIRTRLLVDQLEDMVLPNEKIARLVTLDPQLANETIDIAKTMKVQGLNARPTVSEVVCTLGSRTSSHLLAALAMISIYRSEEPLFRFFYRTALKSAMLSHNLALSIQSVCPNKAFLSGFLSEIGAMACLRVDGKAFSTLWKKSSGLPVLRCQLERDRYGNTTYALGEKLLRINNFPQEIACTVGVNVNEIKDHDALSRIIAFARSIVPELMRCKEVRRRQNFMRNLSKLASLFDLDFDNRTLENICQVTEISHQIELPLAG